MTISQPPTPGSALWVYAHPRTESFNRTLLRAGTDLLSERYDVTVSDLYSDGFDPTLSTADFGSSTEDAGVSELLGRSWELGELPPQLQQELERVAAAELVIFQFPLWWFGPPAILKGWFDRVLVRGFAYGDHDKEAGLPRRYGDGGLIGRRALIIVTSGNDADSLGPRGLDGDIESLLFPITHGSLWYTGIETLPLHTVFDADTLSTDRVQAEVERLRARLLSIEEEASLPYRRLRDGDYRGTRALRDDIFPGRTDLGIHSSKEA